VDEREWLTERFGANRTHLRAVAYRMLGSVSEADDAVQESWLRLSRSDTAGVENLPAWLTTVVARVCLDMLRARKSRREVAAPSWPWASEPSCTGGSVTGSRRWSSVEARRASASSCNGQGWYPLLLLPTVALARTRSGLLLVFGAWAVSAYAARSLLVDPIDAVGVFYEASQFAR
jgi:hypothetical protein